MDNTIRILSLERERPLKQLSAQATTPELASATLHILPQLVIRALGDLGDSETNKFRDTAGSLFPRGRQEKQLPLNYCKARFFFQRDHQSAKFIAPSQSRVEVSLRLFVELIMILRQT